MPFIDIGTHMSLARLSNGNFLIIDAIELSPQIKSEINQLTENGSKIEAVLATHPFHTTAFPEFYKAFPNPNYYGTPRHLRVLNNIPWKGNLNDSNCRDRWSPEVQMRIPEGAEFVAPLPESRNHFSTVFVFHQLSRTLHIDDTVIYIEKSRFPFSFFGYKSGSMSFHPTLKDIGLLPTSNAPFQFRDWMRTLIRDWDFDNICTAHMGNKLGGAKEQLTQTLNDVEPLLEKISARNARNEQK